MRPAVAFRRQLQLLGIAFACATADMICEPWLRRLDGHRCRPRMPPSLDAFAASSASDISLSNFSVVGRIGGIHVPISLAIQAGAARISQPPTPALRMPGIRPACALLGALSNLIV